MGSKESITVKMIKRVYGVTGILDEYRRGEIDKIGNKAFMMLFWYMPLSTFVAMLFMEKNPQGALWGLVGSNVVVYFLMIGYIGIKSSRLKLMAIEVEKNKVKKTTYQLIIKNMGAAVYFSIAIHFINALIATMLEGDSYLSYITSWHHIKVSLVGGILFGVMMLGISLLSIKKIEEE